MISNDRKVYAVYERKQYGRQHFFSRTLPI